MAWADSCKPMLLDRQSKEQSIDMVENKLSRHAAGAGGNESIRCMYYCSLRHIIVQMWNEVKY